MLWDILRCDFSDRAMIYMYRKNNIIILTLWGIFDMIIVPELLYFWFKYN